MQANLLDTDFRNMDFANLARAAGLTNR